MIEVSRREMMASAAAAAALAAGVSTIAMAQTASAAAAWDLSDLYPSDAAWEAERQALLTAIPRLKTQKGTLGRSAAAMRAAFEAQSDVNKRASRLYTYASLKADEDLRVSANQERKQQGQDVFTALGEATAWTNPEVVAIGAKKVERLHRRRPGAAEAFCFSLHDVLRLAPHTLSSSEEHCSPRSGTHWRGRATSAISSLRPTFPGRR